MCNFPFCHYVFKKPSAAEASESVYMRERVKDIFEPIWTETLKLQKRVQLLKRDLNIVEKVEIDQLQQIVFFQHFVSKSSVTEASKCDRMWERISVNTHILKLVILYYFVHTLY